MKTYHLKQEQVIGRPIGKVFSFFCDAGNLERITPEWLQFKILSTQPIRMAVDTRIDYLLRWRGVPMRWRTRILVWQPPEKFVDVQEKGPYRLWQHTHSFYECPGGTRMIDELRYALPLGNLGRGLHRLWIRKDLEAIFDFRRRQIEAIFAEKNEGEPTS
jgi:uncharacterized protein